MKKIVLLSIATASLLAVNFSDTQLVKSQENAQAVIVSNSDTLLSAAKDEYKKGNYDRAIDLSTQAIRANANNINAFYYRGISRLALQKKPFQLKPLEVIQNDLSRVIELDPSNKEVHYYNGLLYYRKLLTRSNSQFVSIGHIEPNLYTSGDGDRLDNSIEQARDSFQKYLRGNYTAINDSYLYYADLEIMENGAIETINLFLSMVENEDTNPSVYFLRGFAYYSKFKYCADIPTECPNKVNETQEALKNFNKSIKLYSENAEVYFFRARTYVRLKNIQSAIEDYTQIIKLLPQDDRAYRERAYIYQSIGDHENATIDNNKADIVYRAKLNY